MQTEASGRGATFIAYRRLEEDQHITSSGFADEHSFCAILHSMKREIQLLLSAALCAPLYFSLLENYKSAAITGVAVFFVFLIWKYQDRIRNNEKVMRTLRKFF